MEQKNKFGDNLIFVGGSARSGTTLVQNMLDSHPLILGGPEFLHLPQILRLRNNMQQDVTRGWIDQICSKEDVDARFRSLILDFLNPFAERNNAQLLSEKTPENVLVFAELAELLPKARFILVVRDPRAIVASMFEVGRRAQSKGSKVQDFTRDTNAAIRYIKNGLDAGFKAVSLFPGRFLIVRYEDVVTNPEIETKKICNFLNIAWDPGMCDPGGKKHMGEQAITVKSNEIWYSKSQYNSNPNTDSMNSWKSSLKSQQKLLISDAFGSYNPLIDLGYDFSLSELNTKDKLTGLFLSNVNKISNRLLRRLQLLVNNLKLPSQ